MADALKVAVCTVASMLMVSPALAATPESWMKVDKASQAACLKAANLTDATSGPPTRYSDTFLVDARIIEGTWPQPHMKSAKARMLCLYNRKTKRVEVQELAEPMMTTPNPVAAIRDIWWRAEDIGGKGVIDRSEVTLMLGSDGKIGGKSGCNNYSANYQITGDALKVYPPMIGTRMACPPAIMKQENRYRLLIETAQSVRIMPEGWLIIASADGTTSRFSKK